MLVPSDEMDERGWGVAFCGEIRQVSGVRA